MFSKRSRKRDNEQPLELEERALAGMVDAGILMAAADGNIHPDEIVVVSDVIDGFFEGNVSTDVIRSMVDRSIESLQRDGFEKRLAALAGDLPNDELRELALMVAGTVMLADGEFHEGGDEDETYDDIAEALRIDPERADELLDEVAGQHE